MHQQVRVKPKLSPADVQRVLQFLADEPLMPEEIISDGQDVGVNLVAAGGSRIELGGHFAFVPYHDPDDDDGHNHLAAALRALDRGDYRGELVEVWNTTDHPDRLKRMDLEDSPGQLLQFVTSVRSDNAGSRRIKDILVGTQRINGMVPVQIYSVPRDDPHQDHDDDEDD
jgi:hypothetical protein